MTCGPPVNVLAGPFLFLTMGHLVRSLNKAMGYPVREVFWGGLSMSIETELILFKCFRTFCCLELITVCLTTCSSIGEHLGVSMSWHYRLLCKLSPCRSLAISLRNIPQGKISRSQNMSIFKLKFKGCPVMAHQFMLSPVELGGPSPHT